VWLGVLAVVFWSPFDFRVERAFVLERLPRLWRVPLTSYYYSTEYRALTELLRKTLFFAPLGVIVGLLATRFESRTARRILGTIAVVVSSLVAIVIELGKVLVPSRFPDSSNVLLETAAVALAYWLTLAVARRLHAGENETRTTAASVG
jgi:glycopeptide antibiotics resistance protein